jgi:hypothetical protein
MTGRRRAGRPCGDELNSETKKKQEQEMDKATKETLNSGSVCIFLSSFPSSSFLKGVPFKTCYLVQSVREHKGNHFIAARGWTTGKSELEFWQGWRLFSVLADSDNYVMARPLATK